MSNDEMTTKPTIDTLLARLDEWGARFTNELSEIRAGQEELRTGQEELRTGQGQLQQIVGDLRKGQEELRNDLNAGLRRVERKIEVLNNNILTVNADIRDLEVRVEKLEAESLTKN
jgi:chromosome segregation ATPase